MNWLISIMLSLRKANRRASDTKKVDFNTNYRTLYLLDGAVIIQEFLQYITTQVYIRGCCISILIS